MTRPLVWLGDSKETLSGFPVGAKRVLGYGLRLVQNGETPPIAKPLTAHGAGVFELKADAGKDTFRVVYVVKLVKAVYVLDAFMKKSKSGKAMPREIVNRIRERLKRAHALDAG